MVISFVSLAIALIALTVNMTTLIRRPRIVVRWGQISEDPRGPMDGLSIVITARRRALQIEEIGFVYESPPWSRTRLEWHNNDRPLRIQLNMGGEMPVTLDDGQSLRAKGASEQVSDWIHDAKQEWEYLGFALPVTSPYVYVKASGAIYWQPAQFQGMAALRGAIGVQLKG
jgi:hypothetical protein